MSIRNLIYTVLLILVAVIQTFSFAPSAISIAVLLLFFLIDKDIIQKLKRTFRQPILWVFCLYVGVQLLGLIHTENYDQALKQINGIILLVLVPMVLYGEKINTKQIIKIFQVFIVFLVAYALFLFYITPIEMNDRYGIHPLPLSNFFLIGILMCLYLWEAKKINVYVTFISVTVFILIILSLGSRINFIALVLLTLIYLIYQKYWKILVAIPILGLITFFTIDRQEYRLLRKIEFFFENHKGIEEFFVDGKVQNEKVGDGEDRMVIWYIGLQMFQQHPFFGAGLGDSKDLIYKGYQKFNFKVGLTKKHDSHSQYLQELLKLGIIGLMALLAVFVMVFFRAMKMRNYLLLFLLANTMITAFTESIFGQYHCILIMAFFIPLFDLSKNKR